MLYALSHPELRKKVQPLKNSGHPDQDEREANPEGFEVAIADEREQRVGDKNEPSDQGEQNECGPVRSSASISYVRVSISSSFPFSVFVFLFE